MTETRRAGPLARCPLCGSTSVQALVLPKQAIGTAFVAEFLLGTSAGVAAGTSHQLASACVACGSAWQPGGESEAKLRNLAADRALIAPFVAEDYLKRCPDCREEILLPATICRHCGTAQSGESASIEVERLRALHAETQRRLTPVVELGPVVAKCSVCATPLRESELKSFKSRAFCALHFERAIG